MVANPFQTLQVKVNADASGLRNELGSAMAVLGNFDKAVMGLGGTLMALAGGGLVASVKAAANFEEAMVGVAKVTDPEFAREFGKAIREMAQEIPIAHEELARIAEVGAQLGVPREQLEHFTRTVAKMASTTDLSADEAANAFARIGTLMDIPYDKVDELGSAMNELSNNMGTSAGEIANVMTRAGSSFKALGLGTDEALGLAAAMNEVSPTSRIAAGGLKRMSDALLEPKKVKDIASALGMTTAEFKNIIDNNPQQALMMVAQMMAEGGPKADQLRQDIGNVAGEFATLGSNLEGVESGTKIANEQMENGTSLAREFETATSTFNAKLQILKNQLVDVGIGIGTVFLPALTALVSALSVGVKWFSKINNATGGLAGAILLLGTLFAGAVIFIGGAISALGGMAAVMGPVIAGIQALSTVVGILLNPLGMLVAAKGAVIAAGTALATVLGAIGWPILVLIGIIALLAAAWANNFGGIRDHTQRVVDVLREEFGPIINRLGAIFGTVMPKIAAAVSAMFSAVEPYFSVLFGLIADGLIVAIRWLADATVWAIETMIAAWQVLEPAVAIVIDALLVLADIFAVTFIDIFKLMSAVLKGEWGEAWLWIFNIFADIAGRINGFLERWFPGLVVLTGGELGAMREKWVLFGQQLWETVTRDFNAIKEKITTVLAAIWSVIQPHLSTVQAEWALTSAAIRTTTAQTWDRIQQIVATFLAWFRATFGPTLTAVRAQWARFREGILLIMRAVASGVITLVTGLLNIMQSQFQARLNAMRSFWSTWGVHIKNIVRAMAETVLGIVRIFMSAFGTIILVALRAIRGDWTGAWNAIVSHFRRSSGIIRRLLSRWRGVIVGIFSTMKSQVQIRVNRMMDTIVRRVRSGLSKFRRAGRGLIDAFVKGIKSKASAPGRAVAKMMRGIRRKFTSSDAEEGPLSDITAASAAIPEILASEMADGQRMVSQAAEEMVSGAAVTPTPRAPDRVVRTDNRELLSRVDDLIREVQQSGDGAVYLDGKKVGTISESAVTKKKTSFEVTK